jgi:hypothetical protein
LEVRVRETPVSVLVTMTVEPPTTAPVESVIVPVMLPTPEVWARREFEGGMTAAQQSSADEARARSRVILNMMRRSSLKKDRWERPAAAARVRRVKVEAEGFLH